MYHAVNSIVEIIEDLKQMDKLDKLSIKRMNKLWVLIPIYGIALFIVLYVVATLFYPGGSQIDKNSIGFSWSDNYWCNLLMENAINGQYNAAKPIAMTGMFVLCFSLSIFWYFIPKYQNLGKSAQLAIQISGILSMTIAFFLFSKFNHDVVIILASLFGLIATIGTFIGLYKSNNVGLFSFGLGNILLVVLNNYVYYTNGLIVYLPIIQKISFAAFLIWICCICIGVNNKIGNEKEQIASA